MDAVGDGTAFGLEVVYSFDGPDCGEPPGRSGGACRCSVRRSSCSTATPIWSATTRPFRRAFEAAGKLALMTVFRNEGRWDTSNVEFDDGRILAYDKAPNPRMRHIDYGLGVLDRRAFDGRAGNRAHSIWPRSIRQCLARTSWRASRSRSGSTRSARSRASRRRRRHLAVTLPRIGAPRRPRRSCHTAAQFLVRGQAGDRRPGRRGHRADGRALEQARDRGGRLFILGVGGSAANASHAVNDFRKIAGIEAYAPTDNVSELTARTNDEGWADDLRGVARGQPACRPDDLIFVLSVGGGNLEKNVSPNLVTALQYAQEVGTPVIGIVGQGRRLHGQGGGRLRDRADG